jgi:hypothetical protein
MKLHDLVFDMKIVKTGAICYTAKAMYKKMGGKYFAK